MNIFCRRIPLFLAVGIAVLILPPAGPASAQEEPLGYSDSLHPDITRGDVDLLARELQLDEGQRLVVETLLDDYQSAFTEGVRGVREALRSVQRDDDTLPRDEMREEQMRIREEIKIILQDARVAAEQETDEETRRQILQEAEEEVHALRNQLREVSVGQGGRDEVGAAMDRMREAVAAWRPEAERLRHEFMTNVQALLDEQQQEQWPAAERNFRRSKSIRSGQLSGESVDLIALVERLDLEKETRAKLEAPLEAYAVRLDEALKAREAFLRDRSVDQTAAIDAGDASEAERLYRQELELRKIVRNVNDEYAQLIAHELPEEKREALLESVRTAGYGQIYRPTRVQRLFDAAIRLDELDEETQTSLEALRAEHAVTVEQLNERLRATVRSYEPEQFLHRRMRQVRTDERQSRAGRSADPIETALQERHAMEQRFMDQLQALITPERFEKLPGAVAPRRSGREDR